MTLPGEGTEGPRRGRLGLAALLLAAAALWLYGGVPIFQVDSIAKLHTRRLLDSGPNPHYFNYPALVMYVLCIPYGVMRAFLGKEGSVEFMRDGWRAAEAPFFTFDLPGHLTIIAFAALGVVAVHRGARVLGLGAVASLGAAAFLATAFLWVTEAHLVTVDMPLAALVVAAAAAAWRTLERDAPPTLRRWAFVGMLAGLAASAKYNGALVLFPILAASMLDARRRGRALLAAPFVAGAAALATFLAVNPYVLVEWEAFEKGFRFELEHARLGHQGYRVDNGYAFHLLESLPYAFGALGVAAGIAGWWVAARSRARAGSIVVLAGFPALYIGLIGASPLAFDRYALPVVPFLALGAAFAADEVARVLRRSRHARFATPAAAALAAGILLPNLARSLEHVRLLAQPDVRRDLIQALKAADLVAAGAEPGGVPFTKPVFAWDYGGQCVAMAGLPLDPTLLALREELPDPRTDLIVLDAFSHDRLLYDDHDLESLPEFRGFDDMPVIQFTPFTVPREEVPFSRKSLYSPYLPDLWLRSRGGPFVELYFAHEAHADAVERACEELGIAHRRTTGSDAFYLPALSRRAREHRVAAADAR